MYKNFGLLLFFLILLSLSSCANTNTNNQPNIDLPEMTGNYQQGADKGYILQAGDVLEIKFFYNPELNECIPIRPDGKISLQLIDEVKASGLSPVELDKVLTDKYSAIFIKPELSVIVREFAGQKVYVGGEVANQSIIPLIGNMTALQAVLMAGGFKETAQPGNVVIITKGPDSLPTARKIDLNKVLSGESPDSDEQLRPYDIVYIPKSVIANVDQFVDQYINKIVPDFLSMGFSYTRYRGKQTGTVKTVPLN